jgi:membrane dipeptidase
MEKPDGLAIDSKMVMDVCQVTTVPPFVTDMGGIQREHDWFTSKLPSTGTGGPEFYYGLQSPPVNATYEDMAALKAMGICFMTLAYEMPTEYGGGFATPGEPLTHRGAWLIEVMGDLGIVLDLSHAGNQTARDAIKYIKGTGGSPVNVVATHAGCYEVYSHLRNLPDDVLRSIAELGGFVGLPTVTWMLSPSLNTFEPFLRHLEHLSNMIGPRSVCLGTDGVYADLDPQESRTRFEMMLKRLDSRGNFKPRFPEESVEFAGPRRMVKIQELLEGVGKHPTFVEMVLGRNLAEYLRSV